MFRYVVVIWSSKNEEQIGAAQLIASRLKAAHWQEPMHVPGMRVLQTDARPKGLNTQLLPFAAGVVIGRTFERISDVLDDLPAPQWRPTAFDTEAILASRGRWLIERCWGNYVAVLRSPGSQRVRIVKDPTGSLPCFVTSACGATVIFSSAEDLVRLGLCRFTIDRAHLKARVLCSEGFHRQPLNEIEQICRGECVELDPAAARLRSPKVLWRPQAFTAIENALDNPDEAAQAVRASVRMTTHTWAAAESRIVHRLSGGLDSSIIAGCLRQAPNRPQVCCYTYFNPEAAADERHRARAVAAQMGFEHLEVALRPQDIQLRRALHLPPHVEPIAIVASALRSAIEQEIAMEIDASMVFSGEGGNAAFGAEAVRHAVTEYVRRRGLRAEVLRIASHVARRTHASTWSVLYRALTASLTGTAVDSTVPETAGGSQLIDRDALSESVRSDLSEHPWFAGEGHTPWATVRRLGKLLGSTDLYDIFPWVDTPEVIAPLCSQPVVETLLRIPLYRLFEGGRDRGIARRAFANDVPEHIVTRSCASRMPGFKRQLVCLNRAFLREVFSDGLLVSEGLLDRSAIERVLADRSSNGDEVPGEIMRLFDVEMWARAWTSSVSQSQKRNLAAVID